jgi:hypothetical protein
MQSLGFRARRHRPRLHRLVEPIHLVTDFSDEPLRRQAIPSVIGPVETSGGQEDAQAFSQTAPRAHHRTRGTQPRHRRERPPLEPLTRPARAGTRVTLREPPSEPEQQNPENVGGARLICGQHPSQTPFPQVSPKREDLTRSDSPGLLANARASVRSIQAPRYGTICDGTRTARSRPESPVAVLAAAGKLSRLNAWALTGDRSSAPDRTRFHSSVTVA